MKSRNLILKKLTLTFWLILCWQSTHALADPIIKPFAPIAIDKIDVYSVLPASHILRVIETSTAASVELGQFDHYPIFVFELIKVPEQRVLKQVRIQKAITLDDGKKMVFNGTMDVIPRRHVFKDGVLTVWVEYFPPRPPGQLINCSYKITALNIAKESCTAEVFVFPSEE